MAVRYTRPLRPRKGPDDIGAPANAADHQRRHWRAAHFDDLRQCVDRGTAAVFDEAAAVRGHRRR
jgi:hypothetical protein